MHRSAFEDIVVGDSAEVTRTISEGDVYLFADISGDANPVHVNKEYAKATRFGKRIAHGMLVCSLISSVLGNELPGNGTIYLSQSIKFLRPVFLGDTITARAEVIAKHAEKKRITLRTTCVNQNGDLVIDGEAVVIPPTSSEG